MRVCCIGCEVLARPLYLCASRSRNIVDIDLLRKGLHDQPANLAGLLQERIDKVASDQYQRIVLGYGLCGKAVDGLEARQVPVVLPRAHDCITLFLGSRLAYQEEFEKEPGTFWFVLDYCERESSEGSPAFGIGSGMEMQAEYEQLVSKYGEDNANYLLEVMGTWQNHYTRAAFIDLNLGDSGRVEEQARQQAGKHAWRYERISGSLKLIQRLLDGPWDDDFLVVNPGETVKMSGNDSIVCTR